MDLRAKVANLAKALPDGSPLRRDLARTLVATGPVLLLDPDWKRDDYWSGSMDVGFVGIEAPLYEVVAREYLRDVDKLTDRVVDVFKKVSFHSPDPSAPRIGGETGHKLYILASIDVGFIESNAATFAEIRAGLSRVGKIIYGYHY